MTWSHQQSHFPQSLGYLGGEWYSQRGPSGTSDLKARFSGLGDVFMIFLYVLIFHWNLRETQMIFESIMVHFNGSAASGSPGNLL